MLSAAAERRGRALIHFSSSVIKPVRLASAGQAFQLLFFARLCSSADVEELKVWLYSAAPLLLFKEKEMEDEV
jgi:hypothetical protein